MKNIQSLFIAALLVLSLGVNAQTKVNATYNMALPMGDTKDFIDPASFRGASIEYEMLVQPSIGVGILVGWNTFYEAKDRQTYPLDNGAITSNQFRYLNTIPVQLTGKYYFADDDAKVRPFVGLGFGTYYQEVGIDNGLFSSTQKGWTLALAPKAGVLIPINYRASITASVDYSSSFETSDFPTYNWLGINIGFSWDH